MSCSRRTFLYGVIPVATTASLGLSAAVFGMQHSQSSTQPGQSSRQMGRGPFPDQTPTNQPNPADPYPWPEDPPANPRPMLIHNQEEIESDIKKLYTLAEQLKRQVEKTNSTEVLSISLVDHAKQIEDLAKQIRNLARAS